jgi:hypothetical protein
MTAGVMRLADWCQSPTTVYFSLRPIAFAHARANKTSYIGNWAENRTEKLGQKVLDDDITHSLGTHSWESWNTTPNTRRERRKCNILRGHTTFLWELIGELDGNITHHATLRTHIKGTEHCNPCKSKHRLTTSHTCKDLYQENWILQGL